MSKPRIARKSAPPPRSPWPFIIAGVGAVVLVVIGFLAWRATSTPKAVTPPEVTGSPRLSVDRDSIDFGKVKLGETVQADFKLKDVGDQPLRVLAQPRVELVKGC